MAVSAKVGSFNVQDGGNTIGNTFSINVGFAPTAIICWWGGQTSTTDANASGTARFGMGFGVGTADRRCMTVAIADAAATAATGRRQDTTALILECTTAG